MPVFQLTEKLIFPPASLAEPDGLLAVGGDLSLKRLLLAYRSGIFPWYSDEEMLWWSPDPRFVLFPKELKVSKSMRQVLRSGQFEFTINKDFSAVIKNCRSTDRPGQGGTWINKDIQKAYTGLHLLGYAHSAETWQDGQLAGGLYGVQIGNIFCGESMFSHVSNASKFAFIHFVEHLISQGVQLIDCQVHTPHLESLGARSIPRTKFLQALSEAGS